MSSTVDATTSGSSTTTDTSSTTITTKGKSTLDSSDFMKLLATQMANQDPMNPMEDTAFVAQMASFTSLEQTNNLVTNSSAMLWNQSVITANSCLGKEVTVTDDAAESGSVTGTVTGVDYTDSEVRIKIGDTYYGISAIQSVNEVGTSDTSTDTTDSTTTGS